MHETSARRNFDQMVRDAAQHAAHPEICLAAETIHNPDEPRHYMSLRALSGHVRITMGDTVLADTDDALICLEVGKMLYLPVLYLPRDSVVAPLVPFERESFCPLKGDATYHALDGDAAPIAWSYDTPFDYAAMLECRLAFDADRVSITTSPP